MQTSTATAVRMLHVAFESLLDILELLHSQKLCGKLGSSPVKTATDQRERATHDAGLTKIAQNLLQMGALLAAPLPCSFVRLYGAPQQSRLYWRHLLQQLLHGWRLCSCKGRELKAAAPCLLLSPPSMDSATFISHQRPLACGSSKPIPPQP